MSDPANGGDERERLLDGLTKSIGSTDRLAEMLEASSDTKQAAAELSTLRSEMFAILWANTLTELLDSKRWWGVAGDPELFHSKLEDVLKRLAKIRLCESRVLPRQAHRPVENASRDADIYRLRTEKELSFGRIGQRFGITPQAAERAFKQFAAREQQEVRGILALLLEIHDALVRTGRAGPSTTT